MNSTRRRPFNPDAAYLSARHAGETNNTELLNQLVEGRGYNERMCIRQWFGEGQRRSQKLNQKPTT
jgi:hypothetical protein